MWTINIFEPSWLKRFNDLNEFSPKLMIISRISGGGETFGLGVFETVPQVWGFPLALLSSEPMRISDIKNEVKKATNGLLAIQEFYSSFTFLEFYRSIQHVSLHSEGEAREDAILMLPHGYHEEAELMLDFFNACIAVGEGSIPFVENNDLLKVIDFIRASIFKKLRRAVNKNLVN